MPAGAAGHKAKKHPKVAKHAPRNELTGLGATIAAWNQAHHLDTYRCPARTCYGAPIPLGHSHIYQFMLVTKTQGVVSGYEMDFLEHTSLAEAQAKVLATLPKDAQTTGQWTSMTGDGCYVWNLQSSELAGPLGKPKIGDPQGDISIVFSTSGTGAIAPPYNTANIDTAEIAPYAVPSDSSC